VAVGGEMDVWETKMVGCLAALIVRGKKVAFTCFRPL